MRTQSLSGADTAFRITNDGANLGILLDHGGDATARARLLQAAGLLSRYLKSRRGSDGFDPAHWLKAIRSVPFWTAAIKGGETLDLRGSEPTALLKMVAGLPARLGLGDERITHARLEADIRRSWSAAQHSPHSAINILLLVNAAPWPGGTRADPRLGFLTMDRVFGDAQFMLGDWPVLSMGAGDREQLSRFFDTVTLDKIELND